MNSKKYRPSRAAAWLLAAASTFGSAMAMAQNQKPAVNVCIGENHEEFPHLHMEIEALKELRPLGYDTVELELPRDWDADLQAYLENRSQTPEAYRQFMGKLFDRMMGSSKLSADERDSLIAKDHRFLPKIELAEEAAALGYRVRFSDAEQSEIDQLIDNNQVLTTITRRNEEMADKIVADNGPGHKYIAINGAFHESETVQKGSSIQLSLAKRGSSCETFDLAIHNESPELTSADPDEIRPVDHVVQSGEEIGAILRREAGLPAKHAALPKEKVHPTAMLPVVDIGGNNEDPLHLHLDLETLPKLKAMGYDTLALPLPQDAQEEVDRYLHSRQERSEYYVLMRDIYKKSFEEQFAEIGPQDLDYLIWENKVMPSAMALAQEANRLHMKVRLVDMSAKDLNALATNQLLEINKLRMGEIGKGIASLAKEGHGVVLITGALMGSETAIPGTSIKIELAKQGVPARSIDLAIHGARPELAVGFEEKDLKPVDFLASDAASIAAYMRREIGMAPLSGSRRPSVSRGERVEEAAVLAKN